MALGTCWLWTASDGVHALLVLKPTDTYILYIYIHTLYTYLFQRITLHISRYKKRQKYWICNLCPHSLLYITTQVLTNHAGEKVELYFSRAGNKYS